MTEPMKRGALARVTTETEDMARPPSFGKRVYPVGFEFEVEDYVSADDAGDGVPFYWGNAHGGGNNVCVLASAVEQAKSAEQMNARELPKASDLLDFVSSALLGSHRGLDVDEVSRSGQVVEGFGRTEDGLTFGFAFPIPEVSIWRTDD